MYTCVCYLQFLVSKTGATFGDDFKGRAQTLRIKQRGWKQCQVALQKVALRTRTVEGCPCATLPYQNVLGGLNCVLVSVICICGSEKSGATFGDDFKGRV